jgi:aspartyl-tRNA synthetase
MPDLMNGLKRTHYCAEVEGIGQSVTVGGFVQRVRDKGSLIFVDLRDRTGTVQLVFNENTAENVFAKAKSVKNEYVVMAKGTLRKRENVNKEMKTGEVEIFVEDLRILSKAQTPPFEITDDTKVNEELRLKYRYLDLRRGKLQRNLEMRHLIAKTARDYFYENRFIEIETPMFMKSTPEGARDYLVPSRVHKGKFYALPQSPQIYKQLLMIAGFDRYIQLARCFRDEDLRADRQPEFTQIDIEMSFADVGDVIETVEGFISRVMRDVMGKDVAVPLPRMTFREALSRYGTDKPDTRFGMEITDLTHTARKTDFPVFREAETIRGITVKNAEKITRKEIDKLTEFVKGIGAKGLAYIRKMNGETSCSFSKFVSPEIIGEICAAADCGDGDALLIVADKKSSTLPILGSLRTHIAKKYEYKLDGFNFLWITEFPFFEYNSETGTRDAMHHPFTAPMDECVAFLDDNPEKVYAKAYDLVLNGTELCSGSIRITDYELQEKVFGILGLSPEEIEAKFGFLVDAYKYAAPPHGGAGIGLDRLAMTLCEAESLRDVTAFPKIKDASEIMSGCPADVSEVQLKELGLAAD